MAELSDKLNQNTDTASPCGERFLACENALVAAIAAINANHAGAIDPYVIPGTDTGGGSEPVAATLSFDFTSSKLDTTGLLTNSDLVVDDGQTLESYQGRTALVNRDNKRVRFTPATPILLASATEGLEVSGSVYVTSHDARHIFMTLQFKDHYLGHSTFETFGHNSPNFSSYSSANSARGDMLSSFDWPDDQWVDFKVVYSIPQEDGTRRISIHANGEERAVATGGIGAIPLELQDLIIGNWRDGGYAPYEMAFSELNFTTLKPEPVQLGAATFAGDSTSGEGELITSGGSTPAAWTNTFSEDVVAIELAFEAPEPSGEPLRFALRNTAQTDIGNPWMQGGDLTFVTDGRVFTGGTYRGDMTSFGGATRVGMVFDFVNKAIRQYNDGVLVSTFDISSGYDTWSQDHTTQALVFMYNNTDFRVHLDSANFAHSYA